MQSHLLEASAREGRWLVRISDDKSRPRKPAARTISPAGVRSILQRAIAKFRPMLHPVDRRARMALVVKEYKFSGSGARFSMVFFKKIV
jgi:hypothetical protein